MATTPAVHVARDRFHLAWDPAIPAIETVESGSTVEFDLLDASGGQLTADSTLEDLGRLDFDRVDQVNGPIAVAGAQAGRHAPDRSARVRAGRLGLDREHPRVRTAGGPVPRPVPAHHQGAAPRRASGVPARRPRPDRAVLRRDRASLRSTGPRSTIPPDVHGGNMDTRHLTAGSTLFLPVFHDGARMSMGDGHAAQGDGEVCGTAIETPMRALVRLDRPQGPARDRPRVPYGRRADAGRPALRDRRRRAGSQRGGPRRRPPDDRLAGTRARDLGRSTPTC